MVKSGYVGLMRMPDASALHVCADGNVCTASIARTHVMCVYMHAYIRAYIHTYIHAYIHTYIVGDGSSGQPETRQVHCQGMCEGGCKRRV